MKSLALAAVLLAVGPAMAQDSPPRFHHLHLNSADPETAVAFYAREFPGATPTTWAGLPALSAPGDVLVVFSKVARAPDADPNVTAYWHFGFGVTDSRKSLEAFRARNLLTPFYTNDRGDFVGISSDTYPYPPGVPGRTRAQLAEAEAQGLKPRGVAGNGYINGPDGAIVEFTGNAAAERVDHVHMWQDDPVCAQLWYQTHLLATPRRAAADAGPSPSDTTCKVARGAEQSWPSLTRQGTYRSPTGGVSFSGMAMNWYPNQNERPLAPTRGRLMDHVGLSVTNLDAWLGRLRQEGVHVLAEPYSLGGTRAAMIEGPSHEAIELVEVKQ